MASKPRARKRFANGADEAKYLYQMLTYWLRARNDPEQALPYAQRLAVLTRAAPESKGTILGNHILALVMEASGQWAQVAYYMSREIRLIQRVRSMGPSHGPVRDIFSPSYVQTKYNALAYALARSNRSREALAWLTKAANLCRRHRIPFEGAELRRQIEARAQTRRDSAVKDDPIWSSVVKWEERRRAGEKE